MAYLRDLNSLVLDCAKDQDLASVAISTIWPLVRKLELDRSQKEHTICLKIGAIAEAIHSATGVETAKVILCSSEELFATYRVSYDKAVPYELSLAVRLADRYARPLRKAFIKRLGEETWDPFHNDLTSRISLEIGLPFSSQNYAEMPDVPKHCGVESVFMTVYYYLLAAIVSDTETMERLTPLIRMLGEIVPIGEFSEEPQAWFICLTKFLAEPAKE